jgi:hypothetical protein
VNDNIEASPNKKIAYWLLILLSFSTYEIYRRNSRPYQKIPGCEEETRFKMSEKMKYIF